MGGQNRSFLDFYGKTRLLRDMALRAYSRPRPPSPLAQLCTHFGDPPPPRPACVLNVCPLNELGSRKIYTKVGGRKNNLFCQFIFVSIGKGGTFLESEAEVCEVLSLYIYFDQCRDPCHPPFATSSVPMRCIQQEPKEASNSSKTSSLRMQQCFFFPNTFCLGEDDFMIYFEIFAVRTNE